MQLIDGLPEIFTDLLGEPVIYTPIATGVPVEITAIWIDDFVAVPFENANSDDQKIELHVSAAVIASPAEGDLAQRVSTGVTMKIATPIRPDDQGMIACALARYAASAAASGEPDGLLDEMRQVFTDVLGEPVVYTPLATGIPVTIDAIWVEEYLEAPFQNAGSDDKQVTLHVSRAVVFSPQEGDLAERVSTGVTMQVVTPIRPDNQGMIACTLAAYEAEEPEEPSTAGEPIGLSLIFTKAA